LLTITHELLYKEYPSGQVFKQDPLKDIG